MNWYTSELQMCLNDGGSGRSAYVQLTHLEQKSKYKLETYHPVGSPLSLDDYNDFYYSTLAQAKEAGKAWVEKGIKPKEASHE